MNRKSKTIIIISLMAAVLIGGAVFTSVKFKKSDGPDVLTSDVPKSNFKVFPKSDFKNYTHPVHHFSFDYPADWDIDSFAEEGEETVLVQSQNQETGIAVFIYPFDEPGPITKKRVLRDIPDIKIENEIALKIGGVIDALGFDCNEREFGPTKEVWFVYDGFLYQISAAEGSGEVLYKIVETWRFN